MVSATGWPLPLVGRGGERSEPGWGYEISMPQTAITKRTRSQAQSLRRSPTDAERKLWYLLRSLKPLGMHFRRQAPIGLYIADFACHSEKLIIELDGSQHIDARKRYDDQRTRWLESQGYRVLRFWNNAVLKSPNNVAETILAVRQDPTPNPSPQGGGERAGERGEDRR